jgi:hypothetical protein
MGVDTLNRGQRRYIATSTSPSPGTDASIIRIALILGRAAASGCMRWLGRDCVMDEASAEDQTVNGRIAAEIGQSADAFGSCPGDRA